MATPRKLPRPFEMHWGNGQIVEAYAYAKAPGETAPLPEVAP